MSTEDRAAILKWLTHIDEDDFGMICDVMDRCETIPEALNYFLMRAKEAA
jgi:hypothetical protein